MSNFNNISKTKEISFVDLILNCWKFKKLFYIFIPIFLISFVLENFISKNLLEIVLKDPNEINLDIYPSESVLSSIVIDDVTYLGPQNGFGNSHKISLNFFNHYFEPVLISKKELKIFKIKYTK